MGRPVLHELETWRLDHPGHGVIEVHIGPAHHLRQLDPDFPGAGAAEEKTPEMEPPDSSGEPTVDAVAEADLPTGPEAEKKAQHLQKVGADGVGRKILVTRDGVVVARLKNLNNIRVSLKEKHTSQLKPGEYTKLVATTDTPRLQLESNFLDTWMRTIVFKGAGEPGVELDPPAGSKAAERYAAMAASPWKRVVYPLTAGLGKGGWALGVIILAPLISSVVGWILDWLRRLLPGWEIDIPWPEVNIPWPDINIPWPEINWPDWSLPDFTAPEWLLFVVEYSKVWVPVLIGVVIGVLAVRRYRKSRETKLAWEQRCRGIDAEQPPEENEPGHRGR